MRQASRQCPQPMHFPVSRRTPPSFLGSRAFVGQTFAQGGLSQARQTMTLKPRSIPPTDFTAIQALVRPASSCLREHANMQHWQPTHRSVSNTASLIDPSLSLSFQLILSDNGLPNTMSYTLKEGILCGWISVFQSKYLHNCLVIHGFGAKIPPFAKVGDI